MNDPVTERCRQTRDAMIAKHGGLEGYFDQLEKLDRQRAAARRKLANRVARQRSKASDGRRSPKNS
jgi:hypothetical protein